MIFDKDATAIQQRIVFSVNGAAAIGHPQAKKEKKKLPRPTSHILF